MGYESFDCTMLCTIRVVLPAGRGDRVLALSWQRTAESVIGVSDGTLGTDGL